MIRALVIDGPGFHAEALFRRERSGWRAIKADACIEWFLRIRHVDKILAWIHSQKYSYHWLGRRTQATQRKTRALRESR